MEPASATALVDQVTLPSLSMGQSMLLLVVVLPIAAVLGYLSGASRRQKTLAQGKELDMRAGETTVGAILAILGLLLAFSFGNSLSISQKNERALVDEAAAIGTAFLRADYLPEPGRTELKQALLDYAQTRMVPDDSWFSDIALFGTFIQTSLEAQAKLWPLTIEHTADPLPAPIKAFVAGSINDVLDAHLYRMESLSQPVAEYSKIMVLLAGVAGLFLVGNRAGLTGRALTWRTFLLSGFLFAVMITVIDTERPRDGIIRIDTSAMLVTIADMEAALRN